LELLVHLGLDTVELGGVPFSFDIRPGQQVISGQQIGTMDLQQIKDAGKDTTVITVITNMNAVANVTEYDNGPVDVGAPVLQVRNK
jgi:PTS system sucrose-specific IIC component